MNDSTGANINNRQRADNLDLIKGFCMLLVIADHSQIVDISSTVLYRMLDHVEVVAFFFVSGYLYNRSKITDLGRYFARKTVRFIIPFIFFLGLYSLCILPLRILNNETGGLSLYHWIIIPANSPLWFLRGLLFASIFYATLDNILLKRLNIAWQTGIIAAIAAIAAVVNQEAAISGSTIARLWLQLNLASALLGTVWIWFGTIAARYKTATSSLSLKAAPLLLTAVSAAVWALCSMPGTAIHRGATPSPLLFYPAAAAGCIFLLVVSSIIKKVTFINYIGRNSITVLGTHLIILTLCSELLLLPPAIGLALTIISMPVAIELVNRFAPGAASGKISVLKFKNYQSN